MVDPVVIPRRSLVSNEDVAGALDRVADLLEVQGAGVHRVRAWRHGAALVRTSELSAAGLATRAGGGEIPGIGPRLALAIAELARTGRLALLEHLEGTVSPEERFSSIAGLGPVLARRIHDQLGIATLEELEQAAHDGRLARVPGFGSRRTRAVQEVLGFLLSAASRRRAERPPRPAGGPRPIAAEAPDVGLVLAVDEHYRREAAAGRLRQIAPRRFNPSGEAWLPILHFDRDGWSFTALYSNTARAHALGRTRDWVVIFCERDGIERQCTVVTEIAGPLKGRRVVRGREDECGRHHAHERHPGSVSADGLSVGTP
jgi:DNA polymerase (family X)